MSLPEGYEEYLRAQHEKRLDAVATMVGNLTEREILLVKEAAVMGFVQGTQAVSGPRPDPFPRDRDILVNTLASVRDFKNLYPTLAALET